MTNKEAIKILRKGYPDIKRYATIELGAYEYDVEAYNEALNLAIKALEKPQVTVFAENASKEEIKDFKQELENVLENCVTCDHFGKCKMCGKRDEK